MTNETWKGAQHPPILRGTRWPEPVRGHNGQTLAARTKTTRAAKKAEGRSPVASNCAATAKAARSFLKELNAEPPTTMTQLFPSWYVSKEEARGAHRRVCTPEFRTCSQ